MIQPRERSRFPRESLRKTRLLRQRRRQDLQGDEPVEPRLARLEDDPHATEAEQLSNFQFGKRGGDFLKRRCTGS